MNIAISFIILSIFYSLFLNISSYQKKYVPTIDTKLFYKMLTINFIGLILELLCYVSISKGHINIAQILNRGYLIYLLTFISLFNMYTIYLFYKINHYKKEETNKFYKQTKKISYTIFAIIMFIVILFPITFHNTGNYIYSTGIGINIIYLIATICIIFWSLLIILNIKKIFQRKYAPIIIFIILSVISTIIQQRNPGLTFTTVMETFVIFIMYHTIENPDMQIIDLLTRNKELTEQSVNEKSNFLFKISQELKKPIKDITKEIDTLKKSQTKEEQEQLIEQIQNNAKCANFIINNITDISSMDIKNSDIKENNYNIKRLFKDIELNANNNLKNSKKENKIKFSIKENTSYPETVYGDKIKLKQILMSIINNSIKYTNEGHIDLEIDAIVRYDMCRFILTITDTGIGMDISKVNKLLSKDEELTEENLKENDDLNLNIPTVHKLLKIVGGNINITSKEGKGTTVTVVINEEINYDSTEIVLKDINNYESPKRKLRVLLVDNNNELERIEKILEEKDIDKIVTLFGQDCIDKIEHNEQYDLIIIKDELEEETAFEILTKLKAIPKFKTPVIIAINKEKEFIKEQLIKDGFKDCIILNDDKKTLEETLSKYM